jgi:hypothetical protein
VAVNIDLTCGSCVAGYGGPHECDAPDHCPCDRERLHTNESDPFDACPDGGRCWHDCPTSEGKGKPCWRVLHAEPFTDHYPGEPDGEWPREVREGHREETGMDKNDLPAVRAIHGRHGGPESCAPVRDEDEGRLVCDVHGGHWSAADGCLTLAVLRDLAAHRAFQYGQYGANRDVPDGTGPGVEWLAPVVDLAQSAYAGRVDADAIDEVFRQEWDYPNRGTDEEKAEALAKASWMRMVREEVAEAFRETDPRALEGELMDVAALCAQWIERIRERHAYEG